VSVNDVVPTTLAEIVSKGPHVFSAPPPKEAFEVWWAKEERLALGYGRKYLARQAWYAALREMGMIQ